VYLYTLHNLSYYNEASPQQAMGYQEENLLMMRNHGFSNSSLEAVTPQQAMGNRKIKFYLPLSGA
jgi:hypothetical protein